MKTDEVLPFEVFEEGRGIIRYELPPRALGKARWGGLAVLGFGVFFLVFMFFWMSGPIRGGLRSDGLARVLSIGFGLLGLPGVLAGLWCLRLAWLIVSEKSRSEILLRDGKMYAIERAGPVTWRRKRATSGIRKLVVQKGGPVATPDGRTVQSGLSDRAVIIAESDGAKPMWLAPAYPAATLRLLADDLAARFAWMTDAHTAARRTAPTVAVVEREGGESVGLEEAVERPASTRIALQELPDGVALTVPAQGLLKGSQGLFVFSIFWNGFIGLFIAATLLGKSSGSMPIGALLMLLVFAAAGIGMLLGSIAMGRRRIFIAVTRGVLAFRSITPFRTSEQRVNVDEIESIRVGRSGAETNDQPVMEVQIHLSGGRRKVGLLAGRPRPEQEWVAYVLRQAAGLQQRKSSLAGDYAPSASRG